MLQNISRLPEAELDRIIDAWGLIKDSPVPKSQAKKTSGKQTKPFKPTTSVGTGKVPEGQRNSALTSIAGSLRHRGMEFEELKERLLMDNKERCVPPLPEAEVEGIARSVAGYPAGPRRRRSGCKTCLGQGSGSGLSEKVRSDPGAVFEPPTLAALAIVEKNDPGEWARLRKMLQGTGVLLRALTNSMRQASQSEQSGDNADDAGTGSMTCPYLVTDGVLARRKTQDGGEVVIPLCNFNAFLVGEKLLDDGLQQTAVFQVGGNRQNGQPLPLVEVPASQFASMSWVTSSWGAQAVINAGPAVKDHLRTAIQLLSGEVPRETMHTYLGWKQISGAWVFLHGGGGIGKDGLITDISVNLGAGKIREYSLPEPPAGDQLQKAVRASLRLLELAPTRITVPLLAAIYRAPLGVIAPVDFSILLAGFTGTQKSELSAQAQAHFGAGFHGKNLPGNWAGTANSLERQAFLAKDAIFTVDDFAPAGPQTDVMKMHGKADRLLRGQGNGTGRSRMNPDGSLRHEYYPRGLILTSGEDLPQGHSLRARMMILEISPGEANLDILTQMQVDASEGLLAQAMSAYLQWLARSFDKFQEELPGLHREYRDRAIKELRQFHVHDRTPEIVASLMVGWSMFTTFAEESGVLTSQEVEQFLVQGWLALVETARAQVQHQASEDVVNRFLRLLISALNNGSAHLANRKGDDAPQDPTNWGWRQRSGAIGKEYQAMGKCVGWVDDPYVYLDPDAVFAAVQQLAQSQGASFPLTPQTLWKRLAERKVLATRGSDHIPVKRTIGKKRVPVIALFKTTLGVEDHREAEVDDIEMGLWTTNAEQNPDELARPIHH